MLSKVMESSRQFETAAGEVSAGNGDLSARTEQQAASLEQTAASMDELAGTVRNTADQAGNAAQVAANMVDVAQRGNAAVTTAVRTMESAVEQPCDRRSQPVGLADGSVHAAERRAGGRDRGRVRIADPPGPATAHHGRVLQVGSLSWPRPGALSRATGRLRPEWASHLRLLLEACKAVVSGLGPGASAPPA